MKVRIFILSEEPFELIDHWIEAGPTETTSRFKEECWKKLVETLQKRHQELLKGETPVLTLPRYLVFLMLFGDYIKDTFVSDNNKPNEYYRELIRQAQNHSWGAKVIVAVSQKISQDFAGISSDPLHEWFRLLFPMPRKDQTTGLPISEQEPFPYADDLIEYSNQCFGAITEPLEIAKHLHASLRRSQQRIAQIKEAILKDWRLWITGSSGLDKIFPEEIKILGHHIKNKDIPSIAVFHINEENPIDLILPTDLKDTIGLIILCNDDTILSEPETTFPFQPKNRVRQWAEQKNIQFIETRGPLESVFLCMQIKRYTHQENVRVGKLEGVEKSQSLFLSNSSQIEPSLLISSSFNKKVDRVSFIFDASEHIARIKRILPYGYNFHVHPSLNGSDLAKFVSNPSFEVTELIAWVYIGHGTKKGVQTIKAVPKSPRYWLNCFKKYEQKLPFVLFCACQSENIARQFAAAGVGVAIGFKNKVFAEQCWAISEEVVPAAIKSNGNRQAIIEAYHQACSKLPNVKVKDYPDPWDPSPVAFLHRP